MNRIWLSFVLLFVAACTEELKSGEKIVLISDEIMDVESPPKLKWPRSCMEYWWLMEADPFGVQTCYTPSKCCDLLPYEPDDPGDLFNGYNCATPDTRDNPVTSCWRITIWTH
jgi:hypothetical protein